MLKMITLNNFAIVDNLSIDLCVGMTAITGETGAGKSIMLDALDLLCGQRADTTWIRHGQQRAVIAADFDISRNPAAQCWLSHQAFDTSDNACVLRRVIQRDGRSRAFINDEPVTLTKLRELGQMLLTIFGQHAHFALMERRSQLSLLDDYLNQPGLLEHMRNAYHEWHDLSQEIQTLKDTIDQQQAQAQLLRYQVEELNQAEPISGEVPTLEQSQKQLENADNILSTGHNLCSLLSDSESGSIHQQLHQAQMLCESLDSEIPAIKDALEMISSALIQADEAATSINGYLQGVENDPEQLHAVQERLNVLYTLARKHNVDPHNLAEHYADLTDQLDGLQSSDTQLEALEASLAASLDRYQAAAAHVSEARQGAAETLGHGVSAYMKQLGLSHGQFQACLATSPDVAPSATGIDTVEFMLCTNKGQTLQPLRKVASGGEMSRISLAIQVVVAQQSTLPTLIFDEVDVGIGGATAEVVGELLRELGTNCQVISVTHQAQVAGLAHHHLRVEKHHGDAETASHVVSLDTPLRIEELARMIGGSTITETTRQHASELLKCA